MTDIPNTNICKNCALMLARIVYRRHWWFPLVREPLVMGTRILAAWHRIDARRHPVRNPVCSGCIRFLNDRIGDRFSKLRNTRLTREELDEAKRFASEVIEQSLRN